MYATPRVFSRSGAGEICFDVGAAALGSACDCVAREPSAGNNRIPARNRKPPAIKHQCPKTLCLNAIEESSFWTRGDQKKRPHRPYDCPGCPFYRQPFL